MTSPTLSQLIPVLQVAIGPVILISGIGLLLLTISNRYARTIDRTRDLVQARRSGNGELPHIEQQIAIMWRRARTLRRAIFFASLSVLFAALLIIALFVTALLHIELPWLIVLIFVICLCSLIIALVDLIRDVNQSLVAVKLEIDYR
jgi:hypothetical protein